MFLLRHSLATLARVSSSEGGGQGGGGISTGIVVACVVAVLLLAGLSQSQMRPVEQKVGLGEGTETIYADQGL